MNPQHEQNGPFYPRGARAEKQRTGGRKGLTNDSEEVGLFNPIKITTT